MRESSGTGATGILLARARSLAAGKYWPNFTCADLEERQKWLADLAVKTWNLEGNGFNHALIFHLAVFL